MNFSTASLKVSPLWRVIRRTRYAREDGWRSSDLMVRVHFLVTSRKEPMMSLAMSDFLSFVAIIVSPCATLNHDCRLTTVGVSDSRTFQMQHRHDWLGTISFQFRQDRIHRIAAAAELP